MLVEGITSRPVHGGIQVDLFARRHFFALEGEGALALLAQAPALDEAFFDRCEVLYAAADAAGRGYDEALARLKPDLFRQTPTVETLLFRLRGCLSRATMGTRLYVAGGEGFIGRCMNVAAGFGMDAGTVLTEHRGSAARRVQCVHCKGITEDVSESPFACSHCGLNLLVRDHYSKRLGAFQGVCIDAEEPVSASRTPEEVFQ
ncbi:putative RNA-binding Zn-ribbon protein involved in translation (DUF1610 family) [Pseudochelatococcus lubricantis]|uniref:RNA-binding Zn-ribbon protein involved in translation (DUF1610 family) n=1 Tax=Pseudochelatococcus lubricantis TaxID=1538102 RepID=A0ABX0UX62_9HYPH|nr:dimethylamine monooxygenase subunit DmmA family protein [Pseudochelatococcus lubricantis]NIJ57526.1 putative RNA-binding Zn-ribbon protein involved in translation (DUF1610 family) [Pseudochelatococcus lubricantis]